jgi:CRISPR system Cascade subunit CasB
MTQQVAVVRGPREEQRVRDRRFIAALEQLVPRSEEGSERRGDRKTPEANVRAFATVYRALGGAELPLWEEEPYFVVAPLFASYPEGSWRQAEGARREARDLGASFARLRDRSESESIEKRFQALLDSDAEDLPVHLRHAVSLLRAHDVPIAWDLLLDDLRRWDATDRRVQRKWARSYWGHMARRERDAEADTASSEANTNEEIEK